MEGFPQNQPELGITPVEQTETRPPINIGDVEAGLDIIRQEEEREKEREDEIKKNRKPTIH